jgi:DNA repair protein RadC
MLPPDPTAPLFIRSGDAFEEAPRIHRHRPRPPPHRRALTAGAPVLHDTASMHNFPLAQLGSRDQEVFAIILPDVHRSLIEYVELFQGCVDGATVYAREVVRWVVATRAYEVVIAHNHPSGGAEPSTADRVVTTRMKQALALIEVKLIDHLIVGKSITSMRERGILT